MKLFVVVVRDIRADIFMNPFTVNSLGSAERSFSDEVNRASDDNMLYKHPEDFELYHIAFFDAESGVIEPCQRVQLAEGRSCVRQKPGDRRQGDLLQAVN